MADLTKVRLVRCPKCSNFLPELPDYSLYQCGGCGAVLQAGSKIHGGDDIPVASDGTVVDGVLANLNHSQEDASVEFCDLSDGEVKSSAESEQNAGSANGLDRSKKMKQKPSVDGADEKGYVNEKVPNQERESSIAQNGYSSEPPMRHARLSNQNPGSSYGPGNRVDADRGCAPCFVDDRSEILRKMDELKEQLSKSALISENFRQGHCIGDQCSYSNRRLEPFPYSKWHPKSRHGIPSLMAKKTQPPFGHQMQLSDSLHSPGHYREVFPVPYFCDSSFHPAMCSCYHCCRSTAPVHSREFGGGFQSHDVSRVAYHLPRKMALASRGKIYHPIAGGAPFVTCPKCFEIMRIPEKIRRAFDKRRKIQCGSCSTIIDFSADNNKLLISTATLEEDNSFRHGNTRRGNLTFSSNDFDHCDYDFPAAPSVDPAKSFSSSSSSFYENISDNEKVKNGPPIPSIPGSPLPQCNDSSNSISRSGKGSRSCRSDHETVKTAGRHNSMKDASQPSETDVSYNEYSSSGVSQNDVNKDPPAKSSKGDSFFTNFMKNFKESKSSQPVERSRATVSVNGHVIPDRQVRKAEKLAGPVHPGNYWYDSFAGFWGVMDGHCLGIIPPGIKEFNYPMDEKCSGGDTGVFANGRELHRKDLDLLVSRGLPMERDRSYIIHMSGKTVDEDTGEELESLGKLAPTIEKVKHGFGMKMPKVASKSSN